MFCQAFSEKCKEPLLASSCLSVCGSICPSVRPYGTALLPLEGFAWNLIFEYFYKICQENSSLIQIGQLLGLLFMKTSTYFLSYSHSVRLRMRNVSVNCCRENKNTHFMFNNFFSENRAFWKVKNTVEPAGSQMKIWCMRIACCVPKATNTPSKCIIFLLSHYKNCYMNATQFFIIGIFTLNVVKFLAVVILFFVKLWPVFGR
jgi:hypothetical protein